MGHHSTALEQPVSGYTHNWIIYVRSPTGENIHKFIKKVVFDLHESYRQPRRVFASPPYQVQELGYAEFSFPIEIHLKNDAEPKKLMFKYDLTFPSSIHSPLSFSRGEKLTFVGPSNEFLNNLLQGGAIVYSFATRPPLTALMQMNFSAMSLPHSLMALGPLQHLSADNVSPQLTRSKPDLACLVTSDESCCRSISSSVRHYSGHGRDSELLNDSHCKHCSACACSHVEETLSLSLPKAFGSTAVTEDRDCNSNVELNSNIIVIDDSDDEDNNDFASQRNLAGGKSLKTGQTSASESRARPQPVAGSSSGYLATMQQQNWGLTQSSKYGDGIERQYAGFKDRTAVRRIEQFPPVKSPVLSPLSNIRRSNSTNRESAADQEVNDGYLTEQSRCLCINCENESSLSLTDCAKRMQPLPTSCRSGLPALRTRSTDLPSQCSDRSASSKSVLISNASAQLNRTVSVDLAECQDQCVKKAKLDVELAVASALHANAVSCVRDSEMSVVSSNRLTEMFVNQSPIPIDYDAISSISITANLARGRQMVAEDNTTFKRKRTADMSEKQPERHKEKLNDVVPMLYTGKQFLRVGKSNIFNADFGCTSQCSIVIDTVKSEEVATGNSTSTIQQCFMPLKAELNDGMFRDSNTIDTSLVHPILTPLKSEKDSSIMLNVNANKRAPEKLPYYKLPVVNESSVEEQSSPQRRNKLSPSKVLPVEASKLNKARKKGRFTRSQVSNSCLHSDISVTGNLLDGRQKTKPTIQSAKSIDPKPQTNKKLSRNIACYSSSLMADSNKMTIKKSDMGKAGKKRKRFDNSEDINNVTYPVSEKGQLTTMLGTNTSVQPRVVLERVNTESLQKCKASIQPVKIRFKQSHTRSDAPKLESEILSNNTSLSTSNGVKVCAVTEPCLSVDGSSSVSLPIGRSLLVENNAEKSASASNSGVVGAVVNLSYTDNIKVGNKSEQGNDQQMLAQFPMCQEQQLDINSPAESDVNTSGCNVDGFHRNITNNSTCGNFNLQYMDIVLPPLISILECPDALSNSPDRSTDIAETYTADASNSHSYAMSKGCEECITGRCANASDMASVKIGKANTREDNIYVNAMSTVSSNDIVTIPAANNDGVLIENEENRILSVSETITAEVADLPRANKCLQVTVASNEQCTSQVTMASKEQYSETVETAETNVSCSIAMGTVLSVIEEASIVELNTVLRNSSSWPCVVEGSREEVIHNSQDDRCTTFNECVVTTDSVAIDTQVAETDVSEININVSSSDCLLVGLRHSLNATNGEEKIPSSQSNIRFMTSNEFTVAVNNVATHAEVTDVAENNLKLLEAGKSFIETTNQECMPGPQNNNVALIDNSKMAGANEIGCLLNANGDQRMWIKQNQSATTNGNPEAKIETLSLVEMVKSDYQTTSMSSKHSVATDTWPQVLTTVCTAVEVTKMLENDKPLNDHPKLVKKRKFLLSQLWDLQNNCCEPVDVDSTSCGSSVEACEFHDNATTAVQTPDRENMKTWEQVVIISNCNLPTTSSTISDQTDAKFMIIKNHDISSGSNNEQEHVTCLADKSPLTAEHNCSDMVHIDSAEIVTTRTEENKCDSYFEAVLHDKVNNTCELVTSNVPMDTGGHEVVCPAVHILSGSDTAMRATARTSSKNDKDNNTAVQTLSETDKDMHKAVQIVTEKDQGDCFQLSTRRTGPELFHRLLLSDDADVILDKTMDNYCFVVSEEKQDAMAPSNNVSDNVTIGSTGAVDISPIAEAIENGCSITSVHLTRATLTDRVVAPAATGLETCSSDETKEYEEHVCKTEISSLAEASCSQIILENVDMIDLTGNKSEEEGDTSEGATEILEEKYETVEGNEFVKERTEIDEENEAVDEESEIIEIDSDADEEILEVEDEEAVMAEGGSGNVDDEDVEMMEKGSEALQLEPNNASEDGASALVTNCDVITEGNNGSQTMVHKLVEALVEASEEDILLSLQQACEKLYARANGEAHGLQKRVPFSDICSAITGKETVRESCQSHCVQEELPLECFATTLNTDDVSAPATQREDTACVTASDSVCMMEIGNGNRCRVEDEMEECLSSGLLTKTHTTILENEKEPGPVNDTSLTESVACGSSMHVTEEIEYSESREIVGVSEITKERMELHDNEYLITCDLLDSIDFVLNYESLCNDNIMSPVLRDKDTTCNDSGLLPLQTTFSDVLKAVQAKGNNLATSPLLSQENYSQLISDNQCHLIASNRGDSCMPENNSTAKSVESCLIEANDTECQDSVSFHRAVDSELASTGNSLLTSRNVNEICTVLEEISTAATMIDSCVAKMANNIDEAQIKAAKTQPQHSYNLQKQQCNTSSNNCEMSLSSTHAVPPLIVVNDSAIENKSSDVAVINAEENHFLLDFRQRTLSSSTEDGELSSGDSESSSDESESSSDRNSSSDESESSSDERIARTSSPLRSDYPLWTTNKDHASIKTTETQLSHNLYKQALHLHKRGRTTSTNSISLITANDHKTEINNEHLPIKAVDRKLSDDLQEQRRSMSADSCELSDHANSPRVANDCTTELVNDKMNTFIETAKALLLLSRNLLQQRRSMSTQYCELSRNASASLMVSKNCATKIVNKGNNSLDTLEMKLDEPYSPTDEMLSVYDITSSPVTIDKTTKHEGDRFGNILPDKKNQICVKAMNETESDTCLLQRKNVTSMFADVQTPPSVMNMELDIISSSSAKIPSDKLDPLLDDDSDSDDEEPEKDSKGASRAPNGIRYSTLVQLQMSLMTSWNTSIINDIVDIIRNTGAFKLTQETFDFDLCKLDKHIVRRIQRLLGAPHHPILSPIRD